MARKPCILASLAPAVRPAVRVLRHACWSLTLVVALVAHGCSGDWSFALPPVEGGAPDPRYESVCAGWAGAHCAYEARCHKGFYDRWQNAEQCIARRTLGCELMAADPSVSFDVNRLAECVYPRDCSIAVGSHCIPPGTAAAGSPCLWDSACRSGICAGVGSRSSLCGACNDCAAGCPSGQSCAGFTSAELQCRLVTSPPGTTCAAAADCQSGSCAPLDGGGDASTSSFCAGFSPCVDGRCVPTVADGAFCNPDRGLACLWPAQCIASRCIFPTLAQCSP